MSILIFNFQTESKFPTINYYYHFIGVQKFDGVGCPPFWWIRIVSMVVCCCICIMIIIIFIFYAFMNAFYGCYVRIQLLFLISGSKSVAAYIQIAAQIFVVSSMSWHFHIQFVILCIVCRCKMENERKQKATQNLIIIELCSLYFI